ncbi:hypothetical protein F2P81_015899 [Scophthalmus maximus]|uniref:RIMS-binding protein 2 n=1 Tax=Scophthalmus maximus TaxID=52904 RepID=A0A6A4SK23_SCOMX|nr:hypothetical protein F2P81_015899 [Scophthalmus maximus]
MELIPECIYSRFEVSSQQATGLSVSGVNRFRLLEERNQALKLEVAALRQEKQQYRKLKAKLHAALQEKNRLNLELINHHLRASKYDQVRSDYDQLRQTFAVVSQERDVAQQQRSHLQGKVENLEEVLKHMHEAVERKQRLQIEHERALVALHTKQKQIHQLQKVNVRDLEQKCRSQSEHFHQLSKDLLNFGLQSDTGDILKINPSRIPLSPDKKLPRVVVGFEAQPEKGNENVANTPLLISQFLSCTPETGGQERLRLLSVKSSTVIADHPSSPRQRTPSEMDDEATPTPRSKPRYTGPVRLCTARYSYNPYDGPNEHPEAELPLVAGKYLYVYGNMDDDGFYEGELLDGQRGLVPSNFVEFVQDKEKPAGEGGDNLGQLDHTPLALMAVDGGASQDGHLGSANALVPCSNGTGGPLDPEDLAEDVVPYPRKINLIKQLARSVIVAWEPPLVPLGWGSISGYNVLVDGELRASVQYGGRTKSLLEKLDLDGCVHRVSVQCATDRGLSDELRCTLLVGANVVVAPCGLRVDDIQRDTAELSWLPSNSNYGHTVFLDGAEHAVVKPGRYRLRFLNLKPLTVYKVTVAAQPHQVPWQLPLEQRERKEAGVEFCTQAAGPPQPPHDVRVLCGQAPGVLQVCWKPPMLSPTGTSNGANVIGYAVCTKGQRALLHTRMLSTTSSPLTFPMPHSNFLPHPRHMVNQSPPILNRTPDFPILVDLHNPSFDPHIPSRSPSIFSHAHLTRVPGPSTNCLCYPTPTPNPTLYLRDHHDEDYHSESSRGSDLSDIMEEEEEELYSEMQHEEGRRRNSHNTPKTNTPGGGGHNRESGRRVHHGGPQPQRRPLMVPSIEVTSENNSEGNLSPITEDVYYGKVARHRTWSSRRHMGGTRSPHDGYRDRRSPPYYDESETEESFRIFVALFDYDPLSMSPNPDAADEELPFKEGQIIRVYGDKDTDGFYRGEVRGRMGLIPCNMVSEIRAEDEETMDQLIKQGFLPLSTPVDRIEQNRRGLRRDQASRRMVALYDYDPRESSPNVDVEAELTFCAGDIMAVFGDIDEDGFYYGEINGHRGLVPSNFLEEVPDDVEVYLTDTPSHYPQEEPANRPPANSAAASASVSEGKRVTTETSDAADNDTVTPVRAPSPIVRPLLPGTMRPLSPARGHHLPLDPRDPHNLANKKKKGLLSKGKKLLKRLSPVK